MIKCVLNTSNCNSSKLVKKVNPIVVFHPLIIIHRLFLVVKNLSENIGKIYIYLTIVFRRSAIISLLPS